MLWSKVKDTETRTRERWEEKLNLYNYKKSKKFERFRLVLEPIAAYYHWIKIRTQAGKTVGVPVTCPRHDPATGEFRKNVKCSACDRMFEINGMKNQKKAGVLKKRINNSRVYFSKAIVRRLQKLGKKYVRNIRLTSSTSSDLLELTDLALTNIADKYGRRVAKKAEKDLDLSHPKFGFDFLIKFNPKSKTPAGMYSVQFVGVTPLTKSELRAIGRRQINPKVVKPSDDGNIQELLAKGGLLKISDTNPEDSNGDFSADIDTDVDLDNMEKDELLEWIAENDLEDEFPLKKLKRIPEARIRKLLVAYLESLEEEEGEDDLYDDIDDDDLGDEDEPDLEDMDKKELIAFAKENDIGLSAKAKKVSEARLRKFIEKKLEELAAEEDDLEDEDDLEEGDDFFEDEDDDEGDDFLDEDEDGEEEPDFESMDKRELIAFAKENDIRLKRSDATSMAKLRKKIEDEYDSFGGGDEEDEDDTFWEEDEVKTRPKKTRKKVRKVRRK